MKYSTIFYCCLMSSVWLYGINNPDMGVSDLNVTHYSENTSRPTLTAESASGTRLVDIPYNDETAAQTDINVSVLPTDLKPTTVRVYYASSPWLLYQEKEFYDVRFLSPTTVWTGYGKTGYVVDNDISSSKSRRLEW